MSHKSREESITLNFSNNEIQQELDQILSSSLFSRSSVLSNFLKFIVEETLQGNTDRLKEYTIAVSALGRTSDFNPQTNAIVRIHAGRLRRLLNAYYEGPGITDAIKIEVAKGTYVPMFRTQVIKKPKPTTDTKINNNPVAYSRSKLTLAILPFRNLSSDDEYEFFVDGFGEELTRIFTTSEDISIVAHFSTLKYANNFEDIRIIGSDLGVHYVIIGSVKRSSKKIRVNVGLVETLNGIQIWSKDYTHDLERDKIIDIQDQINDDVFTILSGHYGLIISDTMRLVEGEMKQDLQAFDAILWFHYAQITNSETDYLKSIEGLKKSLQDDPNNVMCLLVLADLYLFSYSLGYTTVEDPVNVGHELIKRALRLAPRSQYAQVIFAWANIYLGNKKEAIEALEYSVQLAPPSPSFKGALGFGFACVGEYNRSLTLLQQALDLNPYCPWWYYMAFFFDYYQCGKYEEALFYAQKMHTYEDVYLIPLLTTAAKGQLGMITDAQTDVSLLNERFPEIVANLEVYLGSFVLDTTLVEEIIIGAKKAGVKTA